MVYTKGMEAIERWKPIEGYKGLYEVSDLGRICNKKTGYIGPCLSGRNGGYPAWVLRGSDGVKKARYLHQLVARAFVSGYCDGLMVNHKDGNCHNNRAANLEWVTASLNCRHGQYHRQFRKNERPAISAYDIPKEEV